MYIASILWTLLFLIALLDIILRFIYINMEGNTHYMEYIRKDLFVLGFASECILEYGQFHGYKENLYRSLVFFLSVILIIGIVFFRDIDERKNR